VATDYRSHALAVRPTIDIQWLVVGHVIDSPEPALEIVAHPGAPETDLSTPLDRLSASCKRYSFVDLVGSKRIGHVVSLCFLTPGSGEF
jgi:hypothetical protein